MRLHPTVKSALATTAIAAAVCAVALVDDTDGVARAVTIRATQVGAFDSAVCLSNVTQGQCFQLARGTTDTFWIGASENEIVSVTVTANGGGTSFLAVENTGGGARRISIQGDRQNPRISPS